MYIYPYVLFLCYQIRQIRDLHPPHRIIAAVGVREELFCRTKRVVCCCFLPASQPAMSEDKRGLLVQSGGESVASSTRNPSEGEDLGSLVEPLLMQGVYPPLSPTSAPVHKQTLRHTLTRCTHTHTLSYTRTFLCGMYLRTRGVCYFFFW